MKNIILLAAAGLLSTMVLKSENPALSGGTLRATDTKNPNRTAKSNERLVMVAYRNAFNVTDPRKASVTASPASNPQENYYPRWSGEGLINPQNGALTVNHSGTSNSEITAFFSPRGEAAVGIDIVNEERIEFNVDLSSYKALVEKINTGLDLVAKRLDGENPITVTGKIKYTTGNTDKYAVGTDYGMATGLGVDFSIKMASLEAKSKDLPTPWPFLYVRIGASCSGLELKAKGDLKYDEQYSNPWVASKLKLTAGSTVKVEAAATVGVNAGGDAQGLVLEGAAEFLLAKSGDITGKGKKIETVGHGEIGSLTLNYSVSVKAEVLGVGGVWELYRDSTVVSEGSAFDSVPLTIAEW